jgi:hypothetical protein
MTKSIVNSDNNNLGCETLSGRVSRISAELHFRTGSAYFAEIVLESIDDADVTTVYIIFSKSNLSIIESLELNENYNFISLKRSYWQRPEEKNEFTAGINKAFVADWFKFNDCSQIRRTNETNFTANPQLSQCRSTSMIEFKPTLSTDNDCCREILTTFRDKICMHFIDCTQQLIVNNRLFSAFRKPPSMLNRTLLAGLEVNIRIKVRKCCKEVWLELDPPALHLYVFMAHYRRTVDLTALKAGTVLMLRSVLPVYIWGWLRGFACTIRTTCMVEASHSTISDSLMSKKVSCSNNNDTLSLPQYKSFQLPSDIKNCCYLYVAWKCLQMKKLLRHLRQSEFVIIDLINLVTGTMIHHEGAMAKLPDIKSAPAADDYQIGQQQQQQQQQLYVVPNCNSCSLLKICQLPNRSVQHEFSNIHHLELFMMRSGHDADWLNAQLPKVLYVLLFIRLCYHLYVDIEIAQFIPIFISFCLFISQYLRS